MTSVPLLNQRKAFAILSFTCFIVSGTFNTVLAQDAAKNKKQAVEHNGHEWGVSAAGVQDQTILVDATVDATTSPTQTLNYKGNTFVFTAAGTPDTTIVEDPITGAHRYVITTREPKLLTMNGEEVYTADNDNKNEQILDAENKIKESIEGELTKMGVQLGKGSYTFYRDNIVVDKNGAIVYQQPIGINRIVVYSLDGKEMNNRNIPDDVHHEIAEKIAPAIEQIKLQPISIDGEPRICNITIEGSFEVL